MVVISIGQHPVSARSCGRAGRAEVKAADGVPAAAEDGWVAASSSLASSSAGLRKSRLQDPASAAWLDSSSAATGGN